MRALFRSTRRASLLLGITLAVGFSFTTAHATSLPDLSAVAPVVSVFMSPTSHGVRGDDSYGSGAYGASRAKGKRHHNGVDYVSTPGEAVVSPLSGTITKVGYPYRRSKLRFVEITSATGYVTRVMYVSPAVALGQSIVAGESLGKAQDLSKRYRGITNHVHVEMRDALGRTVDPVTVLTQTPTLQQVDGNKSQGWDARFVGGIM